MFLIKKKQKQTKTKKMNRYGIVLIILTLLISFFGIWAYPKCDYDEPAPITKIILQIIFFGLIIFFIIAFIYQIANWKNSGGIGKVLCIVSFFVLSVVLTWLIVDQFIYPPGPCYPR